jgi:hypothetical protein
LWDPDVKNIQNQRRLLHLIGGLCLLSVSGLALESAHAQQIAAYSGDIATYDQAPAEKSTSATAETATTPRKPAKRATVASAVATAIPSAAAPATTKPKLKPKTTTASIAPSSEVVSATGYAKPAAVKRRQVMGSTTPSTKLPYYVDFRARTAASYGHAFVWYGKTGDKAVDVAGLHPKGEEAEYVLGHLTWVPADTNASYGDLDEEYLTASYRVYLSEEDAKIVFAHIHELQATSHWWNAQTNNCTSFIGKIAHFMGLKTPFHLVWPENYVKQMKELNGGRTVVKMSEKPNLSIFE